MSDIEFSLIAIATVLALGYTRLIEAIYAELIAERGTGYWVSSLWFWNRLLAGLILFWVNRYGLTTSLANEFTRFMFAFIPVTLWYVQVLALTSRHPRKVPDWRGQYFRMRRAFCVIGIISGVVTAVGAWIFALDIRPELFLLSSLIFALGLVSKNAILHGGMVIAQSLFLVGAVLRALGT